MENGLYFIGIIIITLKEGTTEKVERRQLKLQLLASVLIVVSSAIN